MLILTRRTGESILIGSDIKVTLISLRGRYASVGVRAPKDVLVDREEVRKLRSTGGRCPGSKASK